MNSNQSAHNVVGVILDWAGTAVDFGSQAPVRGIQQVFAIRGVPVESSEVRIDMGLAKPDHIRKLLAMPRIAQEFERTQQRGPTETDVQAMATELEQVIVDILPRYAVPIPGAVETLETLRSRGIRCGSTTGYSSMMMTHVTPTAAEHGYSPDVLVTPDEVPMGRPHPWMCYLNAIRLQVSPLWQMVKVGDTTVDIEEGRNAGMWTIAIVKGSNALGLTQDELLNLPAGAAEQRIDEVRRQFLECGADYVIDTIHDVPRVIDVIEGRLAAGERPHA